MCDEQLKIPMIGGVASLNVSVSVGMVLYEMNRQRLIK
jgi:23S rRNA (guanosine2251-2'-O)-methyltransferase